jgi:hypothetical protein
MSVDLADAERAQRVLRAVWVIVEAQHRDAVADEVARLGEALGAAITSGDRAGCDRALADVRAWLATMAGVVTSRMVQVFAAPPR